MAAATADLPAIVSSGGPMLDGWWQGKLAGSGSVIWDSRRKLAAGEIGYDEFFDRVCSSAPSAGHCNTMGTVRHRRGVQSQHMHRTGLFHYSLHSLYPRRVPR
jgi:dihydroxyacid dehydratase/phosphogluconate dehydratase